MTQDLAERPCKCIWQWTMEAYLSGITHRGEQPQHGQACDVSCFAINKWSSQNNKLNMHLSGHPGTLRDTKGSGTLKWRHYYQTIHEVCPLPLSISTPTSENRQCPQNLFSFESSANLLPSVTGMGLKKLGKQWMLCLQRKRVTCVIALFLTTTSKESIVRDTESRKVAELGGAKLDVTPSKLGSKGQAFNCEGQYTSLCCVFLHSISCLFYKLI